MRAQGREIVMIGHAGHPEVEGTMGQATAASISSSPRPTSTGSTVANPDALAYVTQTTLSVDDAAVIVAALKRRFPRIVGPKKDDICYATQNRQDAVKLMAPQCDVVIVVGSPNSSNSNRLREVAANRGVPSYMIDRADELDPAWLAGKRASASPRARRRPRSWCRKCSRGCAELGATACASSMAPSSAWCSRCPGACTGTRRRRRRKSVRREP